VVRRILIALAALLLSGRVSAQSPGAPPWLDSYEVVRECPDVDAFRSAVQQRVSRPLAVAFAGLRLAVDIQRHSGGKEMLLGQLSSTDAGGIVSTRTLQAGSCAQLVEALSLIAALSAQASPGRSLRDAPLSAPPSAGRGFEPEPFDRGARSVAPSPPDALQIGPALLVLVQSVATPRVQLGAGLALSMSWPGRGHWAPWVQVGGYQMRTDEVPLAGSAVRARFDLLAAQAVGCPIRIWLHAAASLQPCLDVDIGRLRGAGGGSIVTEGTERSAWWVSTGLALRAEVAPWGPLRISTIGGMVVPWNRPEFFFSPDTVAFRVPRLGWRGALSGAVVF
jgi:hypothetical protein